MLVRPVPVPDISACAITVAYGWPAMDSIRLQHGVPLAKELGCADAHYRLSSHGLHMLTDSMGVKFLGEGEWKNKEHGAEHCRQWRKVYLGIDAQTLQNRAIAVTTNEVSDSLMASELLGQIPSHEEVASCTGGWCMRLQWNGIRFRTFFIQVKCTAQNQG